MDREAEMTSSRPENITAFAFRTDDSWRGWDNKNQPVLRQELYGSKVSDDLYRVSQLVPRVKQRSRFKYKLIIRFVE